jgi:hypothetical protein
VISRTGRNTTSLARHSRLRLASNAYTVSRLPTQIIKCSCVTAIEMLYFVLGVDGWRTCLTLLMGVAGWWMTVHKGRGTATPSWESSDADRYVAVLLHATGACMWEREQNRVLTLCEVSLLGTSESCLSPGDTGNLRIRNRCSRVDLFVLPTWQTIWQAT